MGEVNYKPLIDDMVWSFSRVEAYESCPHRWYLRYIRRCKEKEKFYSSYGIFLHRLIEQYYNGELTKEEMLTTFLRDFKKEVLGFRPKASTLKKFIDGAVEYLKNFEPFPYKMVAVEKKVEFEIDGIKFIGYIDFLGEDESDGELVIIDNKSRDLKPRSGRPKPTAKDKELDDILRQLYIYCVAVEQEYGKLPNTLRLSSEFYDIGHIVCHCCSPCSCKLSCCSSQSSCSVSLRKLSTCGTIASVLPLSHFGWI